MVIGSGPIRTMLAQMSPPWLSRDWGERFVLGLMGHMGDALLEASLNALRAPWLREAVSPDDALDRGADEVVLQRYPGETAATLRARLVDPWATWSTAGSEPGMVARYAELGFTVRIYTDAEWHRPPTPWWSQWWLVVAQPHGFSAAPICDELYHVGDGSLCGTGILCGTGLHKVGDGTMCGITGSASVVNALRRVTRQFKAGEEVCREAFCDFGNICGDGHLCGDGSLCASAHGSIAII